MPLSYSCPQCRTQIEIRSRVTQKKRRCPQCGSEVATGEIDRQVERGRSIGLLVLAGVVAAVLICVLVMVKMQDRPGSSGGKPPIRSVPGPGK